MENNLVISNTGDKLNKYKMQFYILSSFYKNIYKEVCEILKLDFDNVYKFI